MLEAVSVGVVILGLGLMFLESHFLVLVILLQLRPLILLFELGLANF